MTKFKQNAYFYSLLITIFLYTHAAEAAPEEKKGSEFASCLFEQNGTHYAVEWQIDHGPNGNGNTEFNVDFFQVCGCENHPLLTSRVAPPDANTIADMLYLPSGNSDFFSYHTRHYSQLPNNELYSNRAPYNPTTVRYQTKYNIPNENSEIVTLEGLSTGTSKNQPDSRNQVWWTINSNDHQNFLWTIKFNYKRANGTYRLIDSSEAVCQVRYSPNNSRLRRNSIVYTPLPNDNYFSAFEEAYPVQSTCAITCNLL